MNPDELGVEMPDVTVESTSPEALKARIDDGQEVTLLDTRMSSEFEKWAIDGENVEIANLPYFEFLEGVDEELADFAEQVEPYLLY